MCILFCSNFYRDLDLNTKPFEEMMNDAMNSFHVEENLQTIYVLVV